jgi:uncharacterized membrane protein YhiD involved in acid resistance|tara:strand:+ start:1215 stop:1895 length:681 start_codon:yes stop_codon:yes gene_type:complete
MDNFEQYIATVYDPLTILTNMALACVLGVVISVVYKRTHKGLSYSQSFMLTIIFVTVIVSMVMMVIGNSLARAFALVGALSIIRFRTVIKDTKDTAYVFIALAAGMAAGTSSYFLACAGVVIISALAFVLHKVNFGSVERGELILRFRSTSAATNVYQALLDEYTKRANLLQIEPSKDDSEDRTVLMTFDVIMKRETDINQMVAELAELVGVSEVRAIASKTDIDY